MHISSRFQLQSGLKQEGRGEKISSRPVLSAGRDNLSYNFACMQTGCALKVQRPRFAMKGTAHMRILDQKLYHDAAPQ